jgi:hypothetical protein
MMITDANRASLITGKKVLFDTNIWLLLDGPSFGVQQQREANYSNAYKYIKDNNTLVTNEYIMAEYCNRYVKIVYNAHLDEHENDQNEKQMTRAEKARNKFPSFKRYRTTVDFRDTLESARDTCLNFFEECEFIPVSTDKDSAGRFVDEFSDGLLDFSDLVLRDYCIREDLCLMTDDADFCGCDIHIITANPKVLQRGTQSQSPVVKPRC